MLKITKKRRRKERRKRMITAGVLLIGSSLFLWICILGVRNTSLWNRLQYQICYLMLKQYAPVPDRRRWGSDCLSDRRRYDDV